MSVRALRRRREHDAGTSSADASRVQMNPILPDNEERWFRYDWSSLVLVGATFIISLSLGAFLGGHYERSKGAPTRHGERRPHSGLDPTQFILENMNKDNIRSYLEEYSSETRLPGTELDKELAELIKKQWKSFGIDHVHMAGYNVLLSFPNKNKPNKVQIVGPNGEVEFTSAPFEKPLTAADNRSTIVPPYNAYAPAGEVVGDLVYVNYGTLEDFDFLTKTKGISLQGKICIARYGKIYRGDKLELASERGAKGLILYNDPADYLPPGSEEPYPNSWWLPPTGLERGAVGMDGDYQTPLYPSKEYSYKIPIEKLHNLPNIPAQPIGYGDAHKLLRLMVGAEAPKSWQGGFNFTYRLGAGFLNRNLKARLEVNNVLEVKRIYNVIGYIHGEVEPDRYVLMGNHHDAWAFGAVDPLSGSAALTEIVRLNGEMLKQGHRPRRSIIFCSWDGEELGLLGSVEFVEENMKVLYERAVAYLNVDYAVNFPYTLHAGTSPLLQDPLYQAAKMVPSPEKDGNSLYEMWRQRPKNSALSVPKEPEVHYALGSGSDMAAFYQRAGVPCVDMWFNYDSARFPVLYYPTYHSAYETFFMYTSFIDPNFNYTLAIAQLWAILASDLANANLLKMNVRRYASAAKNFADLLLKDYKKLWSSNKVNVAGFMSAIHNLTLEADRFTSYLESVDELSLSSMEVRMLNDKLIQLERAFIDPEGLPGRPHYKHIMFAPSRFDAYSDSSLPGITDTMHDLVHGGSQDWALLKQQMFVATYLIQSAANTLKDMSL